MAQADDKIDAHEIDVLFSSDEVARRVEELAIAIADTVPQNVLILGLLKGCFVFLADLVRALDRHGVHPGIEFLQVSSYGALKESSRTIRVKSEIPNNFEGRDVLLVDDIQDTARTLVFARDLLIEKGANKVWSCALLDKPSRRQLEFEADFVGFQIPDVFVVGYGIDYAERYRHLPFIAKLV